MTTRDVDQFIAWLQDPRAQARNLHELAVERAQANETRPPAPLAADAARSLSDSTIRGIVAPLSACLSGAVRHGLIRSNPAREAVLPNRPRVREDDDEEVRAMTAAQLDAFLRVVEPRWHPFFHLLAATGLRISEAIGLQWRHVHLDGSAPHVKVRRRLVRGKEGPPKSRYGRREVPIPHALVVELRQLRGDSEWPGASDPVFVTGAGTPLTPGNVWRRVLKPAAEEAGVPWIGFHTFRHTCASLLFAGGRNAVQVQRWLGHHSPAFTLATYVHLLDDGLGGPLDVPALHATLHTGPTALDDRLEAGDIVKDADLHALLNSATLERTAAGES